MSSKIYIKRTSVSGRTPNTTNLNTGELALNMTDGVMFSSNGSSVFEIGANVTLFSANSVTINNEYSFPTHDGTAGQTLITNGSGGLSFANIVSVETINDILAKTSTITGDITLQGNTTANNIVVVGESQLADVIVTGNTTANNLSVSGNTELDEVIITGNTAANNLVVEGDFTVSGNITYIDSTELNIGTNFINLNTQVNSVTNSPFDAGININRGALPNTSIYFDETDDSWKFTNNGTDYYKIITGLEDVLQSNAIAHSTIEANNITANTIDINVVNIGNNIINTSNSATTSTLTTAIIDSYPKQNYSSSQYLIEVTTGSGKQFSQINLIYDASDIYISEFGRISTNNELATFSANMNSTHVNLLATPQSTNLDIKIHRTTVTN